MNFQLCLKTAASLFPFSFETFLIVMQSSLGKGISETNLKLKIPCSKCMSECTACMPRDVTGRCMQLLHGLCCFDFVSDIPLSPATLIVMKLPQVSMAANNQCYIKAKDVSTLTIALSLKMYFSVSPFEYDHIKT